MKDKNKYVMNCKYIDIDVIDKYTTLYFCRHILKDGLCDKLIEKCKFFKYETK